MSRLVSKCERSRINCRRAIKNRSINFSHNLKILFSLKASIIFFSRPQLHSTARCLSIFTSGKRWDDLFGNRSVLSPLRTGVMKFQFCGSMIKWVLVLLFSLASSAFASSADSGRCPWKLPFTITIHAAGNLHSYGHSVPTHGQGQSYDNPIVPATEDFVLTLDTSSQNIHSIYPNARISFFITSDTLRFSKSYDDSLTGTYSTDSVSMVISFAHAKDSILSLQCAEFRHSVPYLGMPISEDNFAFQLSALSFDDTSIFSTDSSFSRHLISLTDHRSSNFNLYPNFPEFGTFDYVDFTAKAVTLAGIFRQKQFTDPSIAQIPWHLPFHLIVHAHGTGQDHSTHFDSTDLDITVWNAQVATKDTFEFISNWLGGTESDTSVLIKFVPGQDSIASLDARVYGSLTLTNFTQRLRLSSGSAFHISSLAFDDSSIFSSDSSFCAHNISLASSADSSIGDLQYFYNSTIIKSFTSSDVDLSG